MSDTATIAQVFSEIAENEAKITEHQQAISKLVEERKEIESKLGVKSQNLSLTDIVELIQKVVKEEMSNAVVSSEMEA